MLFNSFPFALFFGVCFASFVLAGRRHRGAILLGASLLFYGLWIPSYLVLLLGTLGANYLCLLAMERSTRPRLYLVLSIVLTLSILAVFKYAAFGLELVMPLLRGVLGKSPHAPDIALPLGISFYSFEIISISVDVYKRRIAAPRFGRYVLFVTFFPHLIAGPIMRGHELLPQLENGGERTPERSRRGVWLFARGLAKKTIGADYLLLPYVTEVFSAPASVKGPALLVAAYSFAFQIYFDFSGYTDMARGLACVMGFELPQNFAEPYLSRNPSEFWRRWHMTLSRWLRDYLYIPLGGNRKGRARTLVNLMITMVLGGLWHGAGLNFVLWGALHGALLAIHRIAKRGRNGEREGIALRDVPAMVILFHAVCFAWIPFRAATWSDTSAFFRGFASGDYWSGWPLFPLGVVVASAALHWLERVGTPKLSRWGPAFANSRLGPVAEGALLGAIFTGAVAASGAGAEFIYFRF